MRSKKPMGKHIFNAHFVGPRISWSREQAQAKKGPCGPTKSAKMEQSFSPKRSPARGLKVGNQPLFIPNQKTTRDPFNKTKPLRMNKGLSHQFSAILYLMWTVPESCNISWSQKDNGTPSSSSRLYIQWKESWNQVIQTSTNWCYNW